MKVFHTVCRSRRTALVSLCVDTALRAASMGACRQRTCVDDVDDIGGVAVDGGG